MTTEAIAMAPTTKGRCRAATVRLETTVTEQKVRSAVAGQPSPDDNRPFDSQHDEHSSYASITA